MQNVAGEPFRVPLVACFKVLVAAAEGFADPDDELLVGRLDVLCGKRPLEKRLVAAQEIADRLVKICVTTSISRRLGRRSARELKSPQPRQPRLGAHVLQRMLIRPFS